MIMSSHESKFHKGQCLEDLDFYSCLYRLPGNRTPSDLESHLSSCPHCQEELAEFLKIVDPEPADGDRIAQEPSSQEINSHLAFIQKVVCREQTRQVRMARWYRWGAIAASTLAAIGLCSSGFYLYQRNKSQALCAQARSFIQKIYAPQSPSDLRLDLPFRSDTSTRVVSTGAELDDAERYFNRALGIHEGMRDAHLGLGYIYLKRNQFGRAQEEFELVLQTQQNDPQALLGRGVGRFEEGVSSLDALVRSARLHGALEDFDSVLRLKPQSNEARFDKIWALYETSRHKEALQEIDIYLTRDSESIWSVKLRNLRTRMQMNRSSAIEREVFRAARARDTPVLEMLVGIVPHQIPSTIRNLLYYSLANEGLPESKEVPDLGSLFWAARILASSFQAAYADTDFSPLFKFYESLSPRQRRDKKALHARFARLIALFGKGDIKSALRDTEILQREFERLKDHWQLVRLFHLRHSAYFYSTANFSAAREEARGMLKHAKLASDPDLIARSLGALASSSVSLRQFDEALTFLVEMKEIAKSHHLHNWSAFAANVLGYTYLELNQLDESFHEYSLALAHAYNLVDPLMIISCLESIGEVMQRRGYYTEARGLYRESGERQNDFIKDGLLQRTPESENRKLNLLCKQGYLSLQAKDLAAARITFEEALKPPFNGMKELEARIRVGIAHVYLEEKNFKEAEAVVQTLLEMVSQNKFPEIAWQANSLKGRLLKETQKYEAALLCFQHAAQILDKMRSHISRADLRQSFFNRRYDPLRESVSLLYYLRKDSATIAEYSDRAKSLTLREYLAFGSGENPRGGNWLSNPKSAELREPLSPGMVTLEYFLLTDKAFAFVTGVNGTEAVLLDVQLPHLTETVEKYRDATQSKNGDSFSAISRELYQILIIPILSKLRSQNVQTLVILPDGPLHLVPFGGLMNSEGRFLLEEFTISYAPSRSILRHCLACDKSGRFTPDTAVLLMDGTSNLVGATQELAILERLFAKNSRLVGSGDISSLSSIVSKYEIIHFSGHSNVNYGKPRLVFHSPQGQSYLDASAVENWKLANNALVTLAGCNSGTGPIFDGEMAWGLIPAFLNAGAPAILVSLLNVDDIAASKLAMHFYDLIARGGISKAAALRQSQLALMKDLGGEARSQPASWVPFILVGDPR